MEIWGISDHCIEQAEAKGFDLSVIWEVIDGPELTYASHSYPGQMKYVGQGLCVAVDEKQGVALTVFEHNVVTELRDDQRADTTAVRGQKKAMASSGLTKI